MAGETQLTVVGNTTADPELRYTQNGLAVVGFTIASTPRVFDKASNEWKDGDTLYMRCSAWRDFAENIAADLAKGMRVIATGNLVQRSYKDRDGNNRTAVELQVLEVGVATRHVSSTPRGAGRPVAATEGSWDPNATYDGQTPF